MTYAAVTDLRDQIGIHGDDESEDTRLWAALLAAAAMIDTACGRSFTLTDVEPRVVDLLWRPTLVLPEGHDLADAAGVTVEVSPSGFGEDWSPVAWTPLGSRTGVDGVTGWPITAIAVETTGQRARITGPWGWLQTPAAVRTAQLLAAAELWKAKDAPFGVAGFDGFGAVRVRTNPLVTALIAPYRRGQTLAACA